MRFPWFLTGSVGLLVACSGSVFSAADGGAGSAGRPTEVGSGGDPQAPKGGRSSTGGAASGGVSLGGASNGGEPTAGAATGGAATGGAATGGAATGGVSAAGAAGSSVMPPVGCPAALPEAGSPCRVGLQCSFGEDPRPLCRAHSTCPKGHWMNSGASSVSCAPIIDCSMTPSGFPVVGKACKSGGEECTFDGKASGIIYCRCSFCGDSASCPPGLEAWACAGPPMKPCPVKLPNEGQACDTPVDNCFYGVPCEGAGMSCAGNVWSQVSGGCAQ